MIDLQPYLFFLLRYQYFSTPFQISHNTPYFESFLHSTKCLLQLIKPSQPSKLQLMALQPMPALLTTTMSTTGRNASTTSWAMLARPSTPRALNTPKIGPTASSPAALPLTPVRQQISPSHQDTNTTLRLDHILRTMCDIRQDSPPYP